MKAVRWHGRNDVRVDDIATPEPGAGQVRIRILAAGICGTDVEEVRSGPITVPVLAHPVSGRSAPITLGHEIVGVVDEFGPDVPIQVGARVAPWPLAPCGRCPECVTRHENRCTAMIALGMSSDGGMAEAMIADAARCVIIDPATELERAVLAEPFAVALHAAHQIPLRDKRVAVVGIGSLGLCMLEVARHVGASEVIAVSRTDRGCSAGISAGASVACRSAEAGTVGADIAIETGGTMEALQAAVASSRRGGHVIVLGAHHGDAGLDLLDVVAREITIQGAVSHCYERDFVTANRLIDSGVLARYERPVVTGDLEAGPRLLRDGSSASKKILLVVPT